MGGPLSRVLGYALSDWTNRSWTDYEYRRSTSIIQSSLQLYTTVLTPNGIPTALKISSSRGWG